MLKTLALFLVIPLAGMQLAAAAPPATAAAQTELFAQTGHTESPDVVGFSPDGRLIATRSHDKTVKFWDVASGREEKQGQIY